MDLFSLVAKLTLDASDFTSKIAEVKGEAQTISIDDPRLGLDTSEFDRGIDSANSAEVDDPDAPTLGLDDETFTQGIEDANSAEVEDPAEPTLDIDDSGFTEGIEDANEAEVDDPDTPSLDLDTDDFETKISAAEESGSTFGDTISQVFEKVKGAIITSGIVGTLAGIATYLSRGATMAGATGDAIDKQSQAMNLSAEAYQEWDYALKLAGTDIAALQRGMKNWQQQIGSGSKAEEELQENFEKLGINAEEAFEKIKSGENLDDLLDQALSALADYTGDDKGAIQEALFGKNSTGLNALLNQTSSEIEAIKEDAHDLGIIMSDEDVKNAAAYTDAITNLQEATKGLQEALGASLLPMVTDAANKLATIVAFFNPRTKNSTLAEMFEDSEDEFAEQLIEIEGTGAAAETLADKLLAMGDTSKMTAEQYAIWKETAESLIELVPSLGSVIDTETGKINANSEEIKENIKQWENLAKQKALQTLKEEKYSAIVQKNKELIDQTVEANNLAADAEDARVKSIDNINAVLTKYGMEGLEKTATSEDVYAAQRELNAMYAGDENKLSEVSTAMASAVSEWASANQKANEAQAKVDTLTEQLEEGKQEYEDWLKTAEEMYGTLEADADDSTTSVNNASTSVQTLIDKLNAVPSSKSVDIVINYLTTGAHAMSHAIGSEYIPYDNYPAILHRGEKVLTATEARQESSSNDYSGMEESIVAAIKSGMEGATVTSYLNGKDITDVVNRNNTNDLKSRRYRS